MPPPPLTADNLRNSQKQRLAESHVLYNPSRAYYAPFGSHNNSEYASQSSDALSFTTDTTDTLSNDPRKERRRQKVSH